MKKLSSKITVFKVIALCQSPTMMYAGKSKFRGFCFIHMLCFENFLIAAVLKSITWK